LVLITERAQMDRVRDLVIAGNNAQIADLAFVRELKSWLRFGPRQASHDLGRLLPTRWPVAIANTVAVGAYAAVARFDM
jgi:hypothetical protein